MEPDIEIQIDEIKDFVTEAYNIVLDNCNKTSEQGCHVRDFLFQMIPQTNSWWMSEDHPIALMLADNNFKPLNKFVGAHGTVVVFGKEEVNICIKSIVEYCEERGLKVNR